MAAKDGLNFGFPDEVIDVPGTNAFNILDSSKSVLWVLRSLGLDSGNVLGVSDISAFLVSFLAFFS